MKPEVPPKDGTRRYAVFLSYRHADNKEPGRQWATWLHQMLENYDIPSDLVGTTNSSGEVIPTSLYPVFRDEEELPADADLTRNIRQALENSALLIVICSPRAVQSRFVAEEIRYFKELGKADRILALMIDGEPNASEDSAKQSSGLTAQMECLPEPLRRGVARNDGSIDWNARTEPIAADARPGGQPVQGWTNIAAYREQLLREGHTEKSNLDSEIKSYEQRLELTKLKIVAGALGVPLGVLTKRDKAMQLEKARKRARTLRRWLVAVGLLAVLAVGGGTLAWKKQQEAARERDAKEQARIEEAKQRRLAQEQSERRRQLLAEAARSDRLVAEERLGQKDASAAFAYLARSIVYDGTSTLAAEKAIAALNTWNLATPIASFEPEPGSYIWSAQFSPDGNRIVIAYSDGTARVWEAQSSKLIATLRVGHEGFVFSMQFSPDGQRIVTASSDKTARVWEARNGKLIATLEGHKDQVLSAQFSPDGQRVVTAGDDKTARIWEAQSGKLLNTLQEPHQRVVSAQFSPDGQHIFTAGDGGEDKTARIWEAQSGKLLKTFQLQGRDEWVLDTEFSPDGQRIVTGYRDGTGRVWEAQSGRLLATLRGHKDQVVSAQFSPNGQRVVTASMDNTVRVWEAQSGKLLATFEGQKRAEFSPDSQRVITSGGSKDNVKDRTARVWEAQSGKLLAILEGSETWVFGMQFSSDGQRIVTASDKMAGVWEAQSTKLLITLKEHEDQVQSSDFVDEHPFAQFSPDGRRVVTCQEGDRGRGTGEVWDTQSGKLLVRLAQILPAGATRFSSNNLVFSPDGLRILTVEDGEGRVRDAQSGKILLTLESGEALSDLKFSPDGKLIAGAEGNATRLWDSQSGKLLVTLGEGDFVRFSPDTKRIITYQRDKYYATVWDTSSGKSLFTIQRGKDDFVFLADFSRDGKRIVTVWMTDGTVEVREGDSGELVARLQGEHSLKSGLGAEFSADGKRIVTVDANMVRVWEVDTGKLLVTVDGSQCAHFSPGDQRIVTLGKNVANVCDAESGKLVACLRDDDDVRSAEFGSDGQHILTTSPASPDNNPRIWTILPPSAGVPPPWFPDFLHYMAQQRLNSNGELELIPPADWLVLRDRLRQVVRETAAQDTPYLRILRHFVHE